MKNKLISCLLMILCGISGGFADDAAPRTAREIFEKAQYLQKNRTFSAIQDDEGFIIKINQRLNKDGSVYFKQESWDIDGKIKRPALRFVNEYGTFDISFMAHQVAIKFNYHDVDAWEWYYIYDQHAEFSMTDTVYNNIPCYLISKKIAFKNSYYSIYRKFAYDNFKILPDWVNQKTFQAAFPSVMEFYVGKKDLFIYVTKIYVPSGKELGVISYRDVVIDPTIKDSVFALPADVTIMPVASREEKIEAIIKSDEAALPEYLKSIQRTPKNSSPGFWARSMDAISASFWSNTNVISYILAGMAIVILIVVMIVKVKRK